MPTASGLAATFPAATDFFGLAVDFSAATDFFGLTVDFPAATDFFGLAVDFSAVTDFFGVAVGFSAAADFLVAVDFRADACVTGFVAASFPFAVPALEGVFFAVFPAVGARLGAI